VSAPERPIGGPAARERLAAEQAALVRALVGGGPVPGGFDPGRVAATSAALARKRAREVGQGLAGTRRRPGRGVHRPVRGRRGPAAAPGQGGALADDLAFAHALARQGGLSPDARVEAMLAAASAG
jgi:hypothetical protein